MQNVLASLRCFLDAASENFIHLPSYANHKCFLQSALWLKPALLSFHTAHGVKKNTIFTFSNINVANSGLMVKLVSVKIPPGELSFFYFRKLMILIEVTLVNTSE